MSTVEVAVEQVLIGCVVLLIGLLCAGVDPNYTLTTFKDSSATAVMALGVAYLIGIVYDRVADTLMEDIEGHYRNLFAVDTGAFAEDRLRIRALRTEQSSSYAGYLRTRIRLSRALATLFPGLSCALAAWLALVENAEKHAAGVVIGGMYGIAFLIKMVPEGAPWGLLRGRKAGRSDSACPNAYKGRRLVGYVVTDRVLWTAALLTFMGSLTVLGRTANLWVAALPLFGLLGALLSGWAWIRITRTFYRFIRDYERFGTG
jgi:hypothetical protein